MSIYWRQWCSFRAQDQHRLGVAALAADDVVGALLHLRAAVRLDCHIQLRPATAAVYERGALLWYASAEVRDEIRRREDAGAATVARPSIGGARTATPHPDCSTRNLHTQVPDRAFNRHEVQLPDHLEYEVRKVSFGRPFRR